jgi:hypothetical protein
MIVGKIYLEEIVEDEQLKELISTEKIIVKKEEKG